MENITEWTSRKTAFSNNNKNKASLTSLSEEAKERHQEQKGELTHPSLQPEARGSPTSFPTARAELAETSPQRKSLSKEATAKQGEEKRKTRNKKAAKLTLPSLKPTKARGSNNSFQQDSGAACAGKEGTALELGGGTATTSNTKSTRNKLGTRSRISFQETMETKPLSNGWLPQKVSCEAWRKRPKPDSWIAFKMLPAHQLGPYSLIQVRQLALLQKALLHTLSLAQHLQHFSFLQQQEKLSRSLA